MPRRKSPLEESTGMDLPLIGYIDEVKDSILRNPGIFRTGYDIQKLFDDGSLDSVIPPPPELTQSLRNELLGDILREWNDAMMATVPQFPYIPPPPPYTPADFPLAYRGPLPNPSTYRPSQPSSYLPRDMVPLNRSLPTDLITAIDAPAKRVGALGLPMSPPPPPTLSANATEYVPGQLQGQGRYFFDDLY